MQSKHLKQYVINPETNRSIRVGGRTHKALQQKPEASQTRQESCKKRARSRASSQQPAVSRSTSVPPSLRRTRSAVVPASMQSDDPALSTNPSRVPIAAGTVPASLPTVAGALPNIQDDAVLDPPPEETSNLHSPLYDLSPPPLRYHVESEGYVPLTEEEYEDYLRDQDNEYAREIFDLHGEQLLHAYNDPDTDFLGYLTSILFDDLLED